MTPRRHSKKRDAILDVIRSTTSHPSAEWVYAQLRPAYPDISLGTVYRNIALFRQEGVIRTVGVVSGIERYDGNTTSHPHFICKNCGSVIDVEGALPPDNVELSEKYGFLVDSSEITYYGTCADCNEQP